MSKLDMLAPHPPPDAPFERGKIEFSFDFLRDLVWPKRGPSFDDSLAARQERT